MFSSTIIATIGREELSRAVLSVLTQQCTFEFELIVVNDSGSALSKAPWQYDPRVTILNTDRQERCVARNAGAKVAKGEYLHFLDDDDWLLPGGLQALFDFSRTTDAAWLYGGTQLVDRQGNALIALHHGLNGNVFTQVMTGEWIPLPSSILRKDVFFEIGGFDQDVVGGEDIDLLRRVALVADLAETNTLVACLGMGNEGSTTNYKRARRLARHAKFQLLSEPQSWGRLKQSAPNLYWWGKVVRLYLTDVMLRLKNADVRVAFFRLGQLAGLIFHKPSSLVSTQFWKAVLSTYSSQSFSAGFLDVNMSVKSH